MPPRTICVTVLARELDLAGAPGLERQLDLVALEHLQQITLDMRRVEFMDCSGLGAIEQSRARLADRGIKLVLRYLTPQPLRLIQLTRLAVAIEL